MPKDVLKIVAIAVAGALGVLGVLWVALFLFLSFTLRGSGK